VSARWAWCWALLLALLAPQAWAQDVQAVPALSARVIDQTATLAPEALAQLEAKLAAFEKEAGPQIVVLLVPTTAPEDIASYTQRLGDTWKIGRRDVGDGLIIMVAKNDRRMWIAPAKALEGAIPDLAARQIVSTILTPAFKRGDFAGGLDAAVDALISRIRGEALPAPAAVPATTGSGAFEGFGWGDLVGFMAVAVLFMGRLFSGALGRRLGAAATGVTSIAMVQWLSGSWLMAASAGLLCGLAVAIMGPAVLAQAAGRSMRRAGPFTAGGWTVGSGTSGGWSGGGSSGSSDTGGFSSGGGGDFGGGGAGGSW